MGVLFEFGQRDQNDDHFVARGGRVAESGHPGSPLGRADRHDQDGLRHVRLRHSQGSAGPQSPQLRRRRQDHRRQGRQGTRSAKREIRGVCDKRE